MLPVLPVKPPTWTQHGIIFVLVVIGGLLGVPAFLFKASKWDVDLIELVIPILFRVFGFIITAPLLGFLFRTANAWTYIGIFLYVSFLFGFRHSAWSPRAFLIADALYCTVIVYWAYMAPVLLKRPKSGFGILYRAALAGLVMGSLESGVWAHEEIALIVAAGKTAWKFAIWHNFAWAMLLHISLALTGASVVACMETGIYESRWYLHALAVLAPFSLLAGHEFVASIASIYTDVVFEYVSVLVAILAMFVAAAGLYPIVRAARLSRQSGAYQELPAADLETAK